MSKNRGFTLIELLVVVAIIGILAAVGVVAYNGYTAKAKDTVLKQSHDTVIKYLYAQKASCELKDEIEFKNASGAKVTYKCNSTNKSDFANKLREHVNNHICENLYRDHRGCMEITGGYLEEAITIDLSPGNRPCQISVRTFVSKDYNQSLVYKNVFFNLESWC